MPKNKKEKNLYDFDYVEEKELKAKKKAEKRKKSASKKQLKNGQAKKYDDEIIIGVTKIPEKETKKKINTKKNQEKKIYDYDEKIKKIKPKKVKEKRQTTIYDFEENIEEKNLKKEKRSKRIKKILKVLAIIAIFAGIICFAMLSPIFNVKDIIVTGNSKIEKSEIISLSEISKGENIFKTLTLVAQNNIKQNAYVENVSVEKQLPSTIKITIEERVPNFILEYGNGYVYINNQGYMLEISNEKLNLPIITGSKTPQEEYSAGNRLNSADLEKLETAIKIIDIAKNNNIADLITTIDISDENNYKLYLANERKTVYLGDCSNLETRMLYVKAITEKEKNIEGEIFVNMNLNSDKAFFREKV